MDPLIGSELDEFFDKYKKQQYRKGEILVRADDDPTGVFYLLQGQVKTYLISRKGDEVVLNIFRPVSFFPMSWAINNTKNLYYYEAMTEVTLRRAPREDVIVFLKDNPNVIYDLLGRVFSGVEGMLNRMAYLMSGNANSRLLSELIISAKRFGKKAPDGSLVVTLTEKDLGTQTGLTRETISREMKVLKERGVVTFQKNQLVIRSLAALEEELLQQY
jgi:CRP/FNR family transcriptional regulator